MPGAIPEVPQRRTVRSSWSTRWAWVLAFAIVLALPAIRIGTSATESPAAAARVAPALVAPLVAPLVARPATVAADGSSADGAGADNAGAAGVADGEPADARAAAVAPGAAAAPPTMSLDAPIQGGLTAHQEQAVSARLLAAHRDTATAPATGSWTAAAGRTAVARAASWLGMPYSWAGGNAAGPTPGRCEAASGGELDCHVVGFDCSGLMMYAWGPYAALPHLADAQRQAGDFHPDIAQLLPGDLVFFSGYLTGGTGHVAIYTGGGWVIEAPQSGSVVRRATLAAVMAESGVYRGAVRPLTAPTPTLAASGLTATPTGGTVTLHGSNLAGVDTVRIGTLDVHRFTRHSDSAIVLTVPAHAAGPVALTVSTSWGARSAPVTLAYVRPASATPTSRPTTATPSTPTTATPSTPTTATPSRPAAPSTAAPKPSTGSSAARSVPSTPTAAPSSPVASPTAFPSASASASRSSTAPSVAPSAAGRSVGASPDSTA